MMFSVGTVILLAASAAGAQVLRQQRIAEERHGAAAALAEVTIQLGAQASMLAHALRRQLSEPIEGELSNGAVEDAQDLLAQEADFLSAEDDDAGRVNGSFVEDAQDLLAQEADFLSAEDDDAGRVLRSFVEKLLPEVLAVPHSFLEAAAPGIPVPDHIRSVESTESMVRTLPDGRVVRTVRLCTGQECVEQFHEAIGEKEEPILEESEAERPAKDEAQQLFSGEEEAPAAQEERALDPHEVSKLIDSAGGPVRSVARSLARSLASTWRDHGSEGLGAVVASMIRGGKSDQEAKSVQKATISDKTIEATTTNETFGSIIGRSFGKLVDELLAEGPEGPRDPDVPNPLDWISDMASGKESLSVVTSTDKRGRVVETHRRCRNGDCEDTELVVIDAAGGSPGPHPLQGLQEHVERYRNSPVMHSTMPEGYKPMLFKDGERQPFPPPTKTKRTSGSCPTTDAAPPRD